jgi:hypothetical protein
LSQWCNPPPRLQVSDCSTFLTMCDVPSMAVFCTESVECCPGIVSRLFFNFYLLLPWPNGYWFDKAFHVPHSLNFYT